MVVLRSRTQGAGSAALGVGWGLILGLEGGDMLIQYLGSVAEQAAEIKEIPFVGGKGAAAEQYRRRSGDYGRPQGMAMMLGTLRSDFPHGHLLNPFLPPGRKRRNRKLRSGNVL